MIKDIYGLSPLQEGMLYHTLNRKENETPYLEQLSFNLKGKLDLKWFQQSWVEMIKRHEIFRTVFTYKKTPTPKQIVLKEGRLNFTFEDITNIENKEAYIHLYEKKDREAYFDLSKANPLRIKLFKLDDNLHRLVFTNHHILIDGWSLGVIFDELFKIYHLLRENRRPNLPPAKPFSTYIKWLNNRDMNETKKFWKEYLNGYENEILLPKNNKLEGYQSKVERLTINEKTVAELTLLTQKYSSTVNSLIETLFAILLSKYNSIDDVVFGTTVSGRVEEIIGIEQMMGLFINTIPVRISYNREDTFETVLKKSMKSGVEAKAHHHYTLADIQNLTPLKNRLINQLMVFENYPISTKESDIGFSIESIESFSQTNYDFLIAVGITDTLTMDFRYNSNLFTQQFILNFKNSFQKLIELFIVKPNKKIYAIEFLSRNEEQILDTLNQTKKSYSKEKTIVERFEEQVKKRGSEGAVVYEDKVLTYAELNSKANILAKYLKEQHQVQPNDIIPIIMERSEWMMVAIWGVLKAGVAYLPIDPKYPEDRIAFMIEDSNAKVLLSQESLREKLEKFNSPLVLVDELERMKSDEVEENIAVYTQPNDLLYLIYTSGSTGKPKGVMVEEHTFINLLEWYIETFNIDSTNRTLLMISFAFDASTKNIIAPLISGGRVVLSNSQYYNPQELISLIEKEKVTLVNSVPSAFKLIFELLDKREYYKLSSLKDIAFAGEPLNLNFFKQFFETTNINIYNTYGPTEATDVTHYKKIDKENPFVSIGKAIPNVKSYILNEEGERVPFGMVGELSIGGEGLSRGYLNQEQLTSEQFINHSKFGKIYKTGDIVKFLENGNIDYIGRTDEQVKIRGFRVELGEIESSLLAEESIKEAVVVAKDFKSTGIKELIAYIVLEQQDSITIDEIKKELKSKLPSHMIPNYYLFLKHLPLSRNGKIDKKMLPEPTEDDGSISYIAPRSKLELTVAKLFGEVIKIDLAFIGLNADFFDIGGHSLSAITLLSKINKNLNIEVKLTELFIYSTVESLSKCICSKNEKTFFEIPIAPKQTHYALSNAQRRLWVLDMMKGGSYVYNMYGAIEFVEDINEKVLLKAITTLVNRHEILRTNFVESEGEVKQYIHDETTEYFKSITLPKEEVDNYLERASKHIFDLKNERLFNVILINNRVLFLSMHHIIGDGWSTNIVVKELSSIYNTLLHEKPISLKSLDIHYKDYAHWQNTLLKDKSYLETHQNYWHESLTNPTPLNFPLDYQRGNQQSFKGSNITHSFTPILTKKIRNFSQDSTLFITLLTFTNILLFKYSNQSDITIGTPIANRIHDDLLNQIGFYANTLALRNDIQPTQTVKELFQSIKNRTLNAYEHQSYPFDKLVDELDLERDVSQNPLFNMMIILQNNEEGTLDFGGIQSQAKEIKSDVSKFDMTFSFIELDGKIELSLEYNSSLFKASTIKRVISNLEHLIETIEPHETIENLSILSRDEQQLLKSFNNNIKSYPKDKTIIELFETAVAFNPHNVALITEEGELTYNELNQKANVLGKYLHEKYAITPDTIIPILLERTEWMMVAVLGVLKAGGAYLPIDSEYPKDRIVFMLEDTNASLLLSDYNTSLHAETYLDKEKIEIVNLENIDYSTIIENLDIPKESTDLAYLIYTSGTTGKPKGVMVEHQSFINMALYHIDYLEITKEDNFLQFASFSFDASVFEMFLALLSGASLVMIKKEKLLDNFIETTEKYGVTMAVLNPTFLANIGKLKGFRTIITAGEKAIVSDAISYAKEINYINAYGPTEVSISASLYRVNPNNNYKTIPIGSSNANISNYILDEELNLMPIGATGEIYIGGQGVTRGYLNRESLTSEKFITHPKFGRIYKSGDLGKFYEDGNIEYMGRMDGQIKIRGHRVELGEIENYILLVDKIKESVVTFESQELIAYLISNQKEDEDYLIQTVRNQLVEKLPHYMTPHHFIVLEKFSLTPNGKVDTKALPKPQKRVKSTIAPISDLEILLCEIYSDVLGVDIGMEENFFHRGGDSIKAIQITSRLSSKGYKIEVKELFSYPTIQELTPFVRQIKQNIPQEPVEGKIPFTPIQKWFFELESENKEHFNQSIFLEIRDEIDSKRLELFAKEILNHHDILRANYKNKEQFNEVFSLENLFFRSYKVSTTEEIKAITEELSLNFKLDKAPLIKFAHFSYLNQNYLYIVAHHLVIDAVSWRILIEDLTTLYNGHSLPLKTDSFQTYSNKLVEYGQEIESEYVFWKESNISFTLPTDYFTTQRLYKEYSSFEFELDESLTKELLEDVHFAYNTTLQDILIMSLNMALYKSFGLEKSVVAMESHGRDEALGLDLSRTVGWFTSLYPVVLNHENIGLGAKIKQQKEVLRAIPCSGIGYGILKYLADKELSFSKEIVFNYLGEFSEAQDGLFNFSNIKTAEGISEQFNSEFKLDISISIIKKRLYFSVKYNQNEYNSTTIQNFLEHYKNALIEIKNHTLGQETTEITPDDIDDDEFDIHSLDNFLNSLELEV